MGNKVRLISFTQKGSVLGKSLEEQLLLRGIEAQHQSFAEIKDFKLSKWTQEAFYSAEDLIFIGAAGIAVRAIAPFIVDKSRDPAVVVIDEGASFAIPLLSGHIGGGNKLALLLQSLTGARAVITTATDINGLFAVDSWAVEQGLKILNPKAIKTVSAKLLAGGELTINSAFEIAGSPPVNVRIENDNEAPDVYIGYKTCPNATLVLVPPVITVGIGCKKGTTSEALGGVLAGVLAQEEIYPHSIKALASIDLKAQEEGLLALCKAWDTPISFFTAVELAQVEGDFSASTFVKEITGVDNVCERSAVIAMGGRLIVRKQAQKGVTIALAVSTEGFKLTF